MIYDSEFLFSALFYHFYGDQIMPNKYLNKKGIEINKPKYKVSNWSEYNDSLRERGSIDIWLSKEVVRCWHEDREHFHHEGAPRIYTDFSIITCHEIRQVFQLPLRQTEGFINSIFKRLGLSIRCPDYSTLSLRLKALGIEVVRYKKAERMQGIPVAIAIDSTGLKRFGRNEWHQEKHKVSGKRSWRKLHLAVDTENRIHAGLLTDRFSTDDQVVHKLLDQIDVSVNQWTADGAYDKNSVYKHMSHHSHQSDIVIPPTKGHLEDKENHPKRNRTISEIKEHGRMAWQRKRAYGNRNYSEITMKRYKEILGNKLHARDLDRQKQEIMIGCGILNKMTNLGMPKSYKVD